MTNEELMKKLDEAIAKKSNVLIAVMSGARHCFSNSDISGMKLEVAALKAARDMIPSDSGELLPCPFCGGNGVMMSWAVHGVGNCYNVECKKCRCRGSNFNNEPSKAIKAWNTRTPDKILEKLREGLED